MNLSDIKVIKLSLKVFIFVVNAKFIASKSEFFAFVTFKDLLFYVEGHNMIFFMIFQDNLLYFRLIKKW
jgi:hypothetical protein